MNSEKLLSLHEKHYFHELDSREKLIPRLQLSFLVLTAISSVWVYMAARVDFSGDATPAGLAFFIVFFFASFGSIAASIGYFIRAFWGATYRCIALATDIESYRAQLNDLYAEFDETGALAERHFEEFLIKEYSLRSGGNAAENERRYLLLHTSMTWMLVSLAPLLFASLIFVFRGVARLPVA